MKSEGKPFVTCYNGHWGGYRGRENARTSSDSSTEVAHMAVGVYEVIVTSLLICAMRDEEPLGPLNSRATAPADASSCRFRPLSGSETMKTEPESSRLEALRGAVHERQPALGGRLRWPPGGGVLLEKGRRALSDGSLGGPRPS